MFTVLHPTYSLRITIKDRRIEQNGVMIGGGTMTVSSGAPVYQPPKQHKYFDGLTGKTGCDEVIAAVKDALAKAGLADAEVFFERFEHTS